MANTTLTKKLTRVKRNHRTSCQPVTDYCQAARDTFYVLHTKHPAHHISKWRENLQGVRKSNWRIPYHCVYTAIFCDRQDIQKKRVKLDTVYVTG